MAFTTENTATGDGSTTDFSFTFPYINESDVKVTITDANGVPQSNTAFTFANATTLSFTSAPASGRAVRIFRDTNLDNAEVTFFAGSAIRAEDLNDNQNQVLFSAQEVENNAILLTGGTMTGPLVLDDTTLQIQEGSDTLTIDAPTLTADRTVSFTDVSGNVVTTGDTGTVTRTMLADSAINAGKLADDSVDSQHYVAGSIDLEHMSANSVDSDQYVDGSIDRVHLAADVIDGTKIEDDAVDSEHIAAGAVDLEHMSANSVDSDQYVDGSIDLVHMSANSVDSDQYVDGSIDGVHIANDAIDSQHYAAGSIDNEHLAANSVDSDQYVDGSIDNVHLAANSVTSAKIEDGTIVNADINSSAAIAGSKISMSLNQLSDVNVGTPGSAQDDQVLAWDNANSEFSLTAASGGGGLGDIVDDNSPQLGGNLDVQARQIFTSTTNGDIELAPNGTGVVEIRGNTNAGAITFNCENNSHGVTLRGPAHSASATYTLTLPVNDGDANQFLQTDGSGVTSWQTVDTSASQSSNVVALSNPTTTDGFTIAANRNVAMVGPLTVNNGETITVGSGSTFKIL